MIEVLNNILMLLSKFVNGIYNFQIDFAEGETVKLGDVVSVFITIVLIVYIILNYKKYCLWFDNINSPENLELNIKNRISKEIIEKL